MNAVTRSSFTDVEWFTFGDVDGKPTIGAWFEDGCLIFRPFDLVGFASDVVAAQIPLWWKWDRKTPDIASDVMSLPEYRDSWRWSSRTARNLAEAIEIGRELAEEEKADRASRERPPPYRAGGETGNEGSRRGGWSRPDRVARARAWMHAQPPSRAGYDGGPQLFRVAQGLVRGFLLEPDGAAAVLLAEYNARAVPPWSEAHLRRTLVGAEKEGRAPWGYLLRQPIQWRRSPRSRGEGSGEG